MNYISLKNKIIIYDCSFKIYFSAPFYETTDYTDGSILSEYSGELTVNSKMFARSGGSGSNYYYETIQINPLATGTYTIISQRNISENYMDTTDSYVTQSYSNQGFMDTYGYIYQNEFYPSNPTINLIQQDDDNAGNAQFRLTVSLRADITYVLVFTTFSPGVTGSFSIAVSGPDSVMFS